MSPTRPRLLQLAPALFALAALYVVCAAVIAFGPSARAPETLAAGVAIDLTLTAAALAYWLAVRPGLVRPWTLVTVVGAGLMMARLILPASAVKAHILPIAAGAAELAALIGALRSQRLRALLRSELEALGYGLGGWFRRTPAARPGSYSSLAGRPWGVVVAVFAFLITVESLAVHMALAPHSPGAAWFATISSAYVVVWLAGDYHALRLRGLELGADGLLVQVGLRWRAQVPWTLIASAVASEAAPAGKDVLRGWVLRTDVLLTLREPIVAYGPFGLRRRVRHLALAVETPASFVAEVRQRF